MKIKKEEYMKKLLIIAFLLSVNAYSQSNTALNLDDINLDGTLRKESIESRLLARRQKLERQTMKKLLKKMEVERIKNELLLSLKIEKAMQKSLSDAEIE